jgi:hypothetical protein
MIKFFKQKVGLVIIILGLIVTSAICSFVPYAEAKEMTIQEKSLTALSDVVGINVASYHTSLMPLKTDSFLTLSQQETDFKLTSDQGNLKVRCLFVGERLRQIFISEVTGKTLLNNNANNIIVNAKGFLQRYQTYCKNGLLLNPKLSRLHYLLVDDV